MRQFALGFIAGVGTTVGGLYYAVTHLETVNEKLGNLSESLTDFAETVEAGEAARKASSGDEGEAARKTSSGDEALAEIVRQNEIQNATPENPVTIRRDELNKLHPDFVRAGFASGRFIPDPQS